MKKKNSGKLATHLILDLGYTTDEANEVLKKLGLPLLKKITTSKNV